MQQPLATGIDLPGFTKEAMELVRDIEAYGWTFRTSNHGVVGRAPDGRTTIAVGRKSHARNRAYQNTVAVFKRWLKATFPETSAAASTYLAEQKEAEELAETDPIVSEILRRRTVVRTVEKIAQIEEMPAKALLNELAEHHPDVNIDTDSTEEGDTSTMSKESIIETNPWHPKNSSTNDGITRVIERVWANGSSRRRVDYACSQPDCPYTAPSARSVTQHFGAAHTMRTLHTVVEPEPVEVTALINGEPVTVEATPIIEEGITVAYVDTVVTANPYSASEVVTAIRQIVSQPLLDQITDLLSDVANREDENDRLTVERDEAVAQLAQIQSDLDALRQLLANIGLPAPA